MTPVQILELMNQSKIVLNTMTWFKRGAHDRIFNGMLAGAAVVSDTSEYMQENFTSGVELELFSLHHMEDMVRKIQYLLNNPEKAQSIACCGYRIAKEQHMWEKRLNNLI